MKTISSIFYLTSGKALSKSAIFVWAPVTQSLIGFGFFMIA